MEQKIKSPTIDIQSWIAAYQTSLDQIKEYIKIRLACGEIVLFDSDDGDSFHDSDSVSSLPYIVYWDRIGQGIHAKITRLYLENGNYYASCLDMENMDVIDMEFGAIEDSQIIEIMNFIKDEGLAG